ncbi:MAG: hypothetical protein ABFD76_05050 [Smithella sp.]
MNAQNMNKAQGADGGGEKQTEKQASKILHVIHHNDPDGICAAAIVAHANKQRLIVTLNMDLVSNWPIIFHSVNYNMPVDVSRMKPGDIAVIVDFSYPPAEMKKIEAALQFPQEKNNNPYLVEGNIIWIDHHASAESYNHPYRGMRDFTNKGPAGCELTWNYYFGPDIPDAVRHIGDYDSWRLEMENSIEFYEGIKLFCPAPESRYWESLFDAVDPAADNVFKLIMGAGALCVQYRENYCASIRAKYGYETIFNGHKAFVMNLFGFGSLQFADLFKAYPLVIAYIYDGKRHTVSLYSETVDVGEIAQRHGGGGHKGAAGFVCGSLPFGSLNRLNQEDKS